MSPATFETQNRMAPFALLLFVGLLGACGDDERVIGDHCSASTVCPGDCQTGGGFPNGICTQECDQNSDCPTGWSCITKSSGICMQNCNSNQECSIAFGAGWVCDDEQLQEGDSDVTVCIGE